MRAMTKSRKAAMMMISVFDIVFLLVDNKNYGEGLMLRTSF
jgi:hypothetical protein